MLQVLTRKRSVEYAKSKNPKTDSDDDQEEQEEVEEKDYTPGKTKKKLSDYSAELATLYDDYTNFRNSVIEKWYDRTKVSTGRLAKSDFSAFDQPILKQIEQILNDNQVLINRNQTKQSDYTIIGKDPIPYIQESKNGGDGGCGENNDFNSEIFDDDHFYHQLLRHYIERKTVNVTDPSQLGRKWAELQKLRSKMKRKIDTRSTKGRKLRFNTHPKLVNFMAPISERNEIIASELYGSLFGKCAI